VLAGASVQLSALGRVRRAAACRMKAPNAADVGSPIEVRSSKRPMVLKVVAAAATLTLSQFDQCAVAILADIVFGWRLLRERRLNAQGESSTGGDTFATVVAISTSL
jgi:mannose/fructose/N-acetylgalactosamine-specific phosphotransferase system component IIC